MGGLFRDVVAYFAGADLKDALRRELGRASGSEAQQASILSAAALVAALADWTTRPDGQEWLETELPSIDSSLSGIAELSANGDYHRFGDGVVTRLFGEDADRLVDHLAESSGLQPEGASMALATTAWVTAAHLARRQGADNGSGVIRALLQDEERDLRLEGWGPWIDGALGDTPTLGLEGRPPTRSTPRPMLDAGPSIAPSAARPGPANVAIREDRPKWRRRTVGVVVLLAAAAGLAAALWWQGVNEDQLATAEPATDTPVTNGDDTAGADDDATSTTATTTAPAPPTTTTTTPIETTEASEPPEVVEYSVALSDPLEIVDASGTVELVLNTVSGEICYAFDLEGLATPYAAHVHIGPRGGSGGITVDFGLLDGVDSGCVQANPADLVAAASRPSARYVEAHDPSGAFSVRGQLGAPDGSESDPATVVDVDDRAHVEIVGGAVILRGAVPDQETAGAFAASYADLDVGSIQVVDELQVVPGAEPPSELVIIADSVLFDVDSAELSVAANDMLVGLAEVLAARPTWSVTAVGHTDSTGSIFHNFSLSLRRAAAVQAALAGFGAPRLMVTVEGLGPVAPTASNDTAGGRAANRRIDLLVDTSP